jgi:hypothetical protein
MSKFQPGQLKPVNSGIKKGGVQRRRVIRERVEALLMSKGKNPVTEIIKELELIDKPETRANIWLKLMEYTYPKLSAQDITTDVQDDDDEMIDVTPLSKEELIALARSRKDEK